MVRFWALKVTRISQTLKTQNGRRERYVRKFKTFSAKITAINLLTTKVKYRKSKTDKLFLNEYYSRLEFRQGIYRAKNISQQ